MDIFLELWTDLGQEGFFSAMENTAEVGATAAPSGQFDDPPQDRTQGQASSTSQAEGSKLSCKAEITNTDEGEISDPSDGSEYDSEEVRQYYSSLQNGDADGEEYEDDDDAEQRMGLVEEADWELARGDFTKAFNRSRQTDAALRGTASTSAAPPLPAMNRRVRYNAAAASDSTAPAASTVLQPNEVAGSSTATAIAQHKDKTEAQLAALTTRFGNRLSLLQETYDPSLSVGGRLGGSVVPRKALGEGHARVKDKADRATSQQVLDPRTMLILYKMVQRGLLSNINGVVSTGKEANVYHAYAPPPEDAPEDLSKRQSLALKIYKTSILVFKDRDRYVSGEFRFRHGYSRHNPRKMVRLWAEKEARNLKRLYTAGIRSPKVADLRDHVLVMDFLGKEDGWASPRLRDAEGIIDEEEQKSGAPQGSRWEELYREALVATRIMYQHCRLVHADLSEYNIL